MSLLQKFETVCFPLLAALIGVGYVAAVLFNNPFDSVIHSPHALVLLVILIIITIFPIRSLYKLLGNKGAAEDGDG
ncbi:MAG: hypothetical protein IEMM0002_0109 [bacterium]|nr:MAG: hypothetical protein IEMM0002_0109 [bacterium]